MLDDSTPVEVMRCGTDGDVTWAAKTFRFEILSVKAQEGHDLVDFRLSEVDILKADTDAEMGSAFSGRGDRGDGGGYSLVSDGGALTLESAQLFDESDNQDVAVCWRSFRWAEAQEKMAKA